MERLGLLKVYLRAGLIKQISSSKCDSIDCSSIV